MSVVCTGCGRIWYVSIWSRRLKEQQVVLIPRQRRIPKADFAFTWPGTVKDGPQIHHLRPHGGVGPLVGLSGVQAPRMTGVSPLAPRVRTNHAIVEFGGTTIFEACVRLTVTLPCLDGYWICGETQGSEQMVYRLLRADCVRDRPAEEQLHTETKGTCRLLPKHVCSKDLPPPSSMSTSCLGRLHRTDPISQTVMIKDH